MALVALKEEKSELVCFLSHSVIYSAVQLIIITVF